MAQGGVGQPAAPDAPPAAFASERLTLTAQGQVSYRLKKPWPDGRAHLVLSPVAFLRRLAGILPPPRRHLVRYAGVFGPRAKLRARVVALAPAGVAQAASAADPATEPTAPAAHAVTTPRRSTRLPWADLLQRVFAVHVLAGPCSGRRRVLAFITDLDVAKEILTALGLSATIPTFAPARAPPQPSWDHGLDPDTAADTAELGDESVDPTRDDFAHPPGTSPPLLARAGHRPRRDAVVRTSSDGGQRSAPQR